MDDLIKRADAIEAVVNMQDGSGQTYEFVREAMFALNALPSAELPKGDLISRAEVLNLFPNAFYDGLASQIKALPSADAVDVAHDIP